MINVYTHVHTAASLVHTAMDERLAVPREWVLNAESEYRFELDPGTSVAIKV